MVCYYPLTAYYRQDMKLVFVEPRNGHSGVVKLPCGRCGGCRFEQSRQWALRCVHEAQMHADSCFITLTYSDEFLPDPPSLDKKVFSLFMKRLRIRFARSIEFVNKFGDKETLRIPDGIRYFQVGEYGSRRGRPHYHALLFGCNFPDRVFCKKTRSGSRLFTSDILSELWPYGFSSIGDLTFESAAYCARYSVKKITGKAAVKHYGGLEPEFALMSRGKLGGIGKPWFDKYASDVYPTDEVVFRGKKSKPPRYYDKLLEKSNVDLYRRIKDFRYENRKEEDTPERLAVRARVHELKAMKLIRSFDDGDSSSVSVEIDNLEDFKDFTPQD